MDGMQEFRDLYIQTARERIQQLNDTLLKLEKNPEELEIVEELMRTGHSLKGESAAMGFEQIATLAHVVEDLFSAIGAGRMKITTEIMDTLFESFDYIEKSVDQIASDVNAMDLDSKSHVEKLKKITGLKTEGFGKSQKGDKKDTGEEKKEEKAKVEEKIVEKAKVEEKIVEKAKVEEKIVEKAKKSPAAKKVDSGQISTVTMKVEKLDKMMSISEELILLKMKLKNSKSVQSNSTLKAEIHRLDRLVTDMQFHIMQARLFPISLALHSLPRLVRDISKKTEKDVQLVMEGQDTTVDRTIIDHLTEPFVHMIRNGVDHGIESAEERAAAGKSKQATIKVVAYTKENKFFIDISDDGRGIEWDKLVEASIRKGSVDADVVAKWNINQKKKLLFLDGVSTNEKVTDVSGRGVGMSAVERAIKKLGGDIMVESEAGVGTTFTLRMPLTLAIMQSLLVKVGDQTYAIPSNEVVRSIQFNKQDVQHSGNVPTIVVDKQQVSLLNLDDMFGLSSATKNNSSGDGEKKMKVEEKNKLSADEKAKVDLELADQIWGDCCMMEEKEHTEKDEKVNKDAKKIAKTDSGIVTVVLIKHGLGMFGCLVNKILAEEEILVKQLGPVLKKQSSFFSGATILADGSAAPIINLEGLL